MPDAARRSEREDIRARLLARRDAIQPTERRAHDERIAQALKRMEELRRARCIMLYVSVRGEVATEALIRGLLEERKRVAVPWCGPGGRILAAEIRDFDRDLVCGRYGIPAPPAGRLEIVPVDEIDFFAVPGLGFDLAGVRLGRGKGYYDAFLAGSPGIKVGLAYEVQVMRRLERAPHDILMDMIVTEDRVIDCRKIRGAVGRLTSSDLIARNRSLITNH